MTRAEQSKAIRRRIDLEPINAAGWPLPERESCGTEELGPDMVSNFLRQFLKEQASRLRIDFSALFQVLADLLLGCFFPLHVLLRHGGGRWQRLSHSESPNNLVVQNL